MNYKAELRGFALDRALRLVEANKREASANSTATLSDIIKNADIIVDYLYIPEKDIKSHLETVVPMIIQANDVDKVDSLILELQQISAEMKAGVAK